LIVVDIGSAIFGFLYQIGDAAAFLVLASAGLAVVFGMMGVINMAHGEFIMFGAYGTAMAVRAGLPLPLAIVAGSLATGAIGIIIERLVICRLYGRPLDTIVATWGISLIFSQGTLILLGSSFPGAGTPLGSFTVGDYSYSWYRLILMLAAIVLLVGLWLLVNRTRFGILARATIQMPQMAEALGVKTRVVYSLTFGLGAALAGLTGGLYAPTMTMVPTMGSTFILEAFVTVVVGGADVFLGTAPAAGALGITKAIFTSWQGQLTGQIALLVAVILVIRLLPRGLSGWILKERS
jgi:branched-chain amino acid transport system permease protein